MLIRNVLLAALLACVAAPALADNEFAAGEKVFKKCKACHDVGEGAKNKVGPALNGIVGAEIASVDGFKYSDAFIAKKGEAMVWDEGNLDAFLTKPKEFIPGTKMTFAGLKKAEDREHVIAYLNSLN